jgi:hypothetical protein
MSVGLWLGVLVGMTVGAVLGMTVGAVLGMTVGEVLGRCKDTSDIYTVENVKKRESRPRQVEKCSAIPRMNHGYASLRAGSPGPEKGCGG